MSESSGRARVSQVLLAFDRSLRSIDADGHMRVEESRITKANICAYLGREIPKWQELGLDQAKTYRLFRDPKELEKAAQTFEGKPLLITHVPIDADVPRKELWVGTIGSVTWEDPYLVTRPLMVLTQPAIDAINSLKQRELSAAYRYDAVMEKGAWGGESYDGRMVNIRGNHVAIVSEGRVGHDVHVADSKPPELRLMKHTLAASIAAVLGTVLPKEVDHRAIAVALDGALGETPAESVISLDASEMKACEDAALAEKKAEHGADAELDEEDKEKAYEKARDRKKAKDKKAKDAKSAKDAKRAKDSAAQDAARDKALDEREAGMDAREEAMDAEKDDDEAKDRKAARDSRKAARDKRAHDALPDPKDHRNDFRSGDSRAEDSVTKDELPAILKTHGDTIRAEARDAAVAREKVRPIVGQVSVALDSAPEIYRFALKHAGVKTDGVHDSALGAMVDMAVTSRSRTAAPRDSGLALDAATAKHTDIGALFGARA